MPMITYASQQGTPWNGFNGLGAAFAVDDYGFDPVAGDTATMLDGTVATVVLDSDGVLAGFVGAFNAVTGTTNSYDVNGKLIATTEPITGALTAFTTFLQSLTGTVTGTGTGTGTPKKTVGTWTPMTWLLLGGGAYLLFFSGGGDGRRRRNPQRRRHMSTRDRERFQRWVYGTDHPHTRRRPLRPY